jgi:hypothetical protein
MRFTTSSITTRGTPRKVSGPLFQMLVENFNRNGCSGPHSPLGVTLAPLLNYLVEHSIPFRLIYDPELHSYVVYKGTGYLNDTKGVATRSA